MTTVLTVTAKGQVTFRKEVLHHLGVAAGDKLSVDLLPNGRAELRSVKTPGSVAGFIGCLHRPGAPGHTIAEIRELAAQGWLSRR